MTEWQSGLKVALVVLFQPNLPKRVIFDGCPWSTNPWLSSNFKNNWKVVAVAIRLHLAISSSPRDRKPGVNGLASFYMAIGGN